MDSMRQNKFARFIQKELTDIFLHNGTSFYGKAFVTITLVRMTPDLGVARIYLSLFGVKDREIVMEQIRKHSKEVRKHLGVRIKNHVRHIPDLEFFLDESLDYAENIERLLKESKK